MNIRQVIDQIAVDKTEKAMADLVSIVLNKGLSDHNIVYLAEKLASSGNRLKFDSKIKTADIPSTGGPSSLSTLLCPLFLMQMGFSIPKLGVPGSPAGAIDVLAQIDGYKINYSEKELRKKLPKSKYIHLIADDQFCPLDIKLFEFRKKVHHQNLFPLVIASLLSKKISLGVKNIGLDVRIWSGGNFGVSLKEARQNASRFIRVSKLLGTWAKCYLNNIETPSQPYIGRGESLLALKELFDGKAEPDLENHSRLCFLMAKSLVRQNSKCSYDIRVAKSNFSTNLKNQETSYSNFEKAVDRLKEQRVYPITAEKEGFLVIDLPKIKKIISNHQAKFISPINKFPDSCGCILRKQSGFFVEKGDLLCVLRIEKGTDKKLINDFRTVFNFTPSVFDTNKFEIVS